MLTAAKLGATVILLNRPSERATAAEQQAAAAASDPDATIFAIECDLGSFESTRAAAAAIRQKFGDTGLDVLCCNAGVMACADEATCDGYDVQIQTNHLSHFLLQCELFPLLQKAAAQRGEARIVNHSSLARSGAQLDERFFQHNGGDLGGNGSSMFCGGARWVRYHQSKLAQPVLTAALHKKLCSSHVPANARIKVLTAAPGYAATQLQVSAYQSGGFVGGCEVWTTRMMQSAADGSMPLLHACFDPAPNSGELWEPKGGMTGQVALAKPKAEEIDPASMDMLWKASEKACGVDFSTAIQKGIAGPDL
jgi:NAD(P)-dependent dehydrogenase (short-subunit alcohol dehydrogenase family)